MLDEPSPLDSGFRGRREHRRLVLGVASPSAITSSSIIAPA
jgi:hypothetical protein